MHDITTHNGIITTLAFELSLSLLGIPEGICFFVIGGNVDDDLLNKILCVKKDVFLLTNWAFITRKCISFYFTHIKNVNSLETQTQIILIVFDIYHIFNTICHEHVKNSSYLVTKLNILVE